MGFVCTMKTKYQLGIADEIQFQLWLFNNSFLVDCC